MTDQHGTLTSDWGTFDAEFDLDATDRHGTLTSDWGAFTAVMQAEARHHGDPIPTPDYVPRPAFRLYANDGRTFIKNLPLAKGKWRDAGNDVGNVTFSQPVAECTDVDARCVVKAYWMGKAREGAFIGDRGTELAVNGRPWREFNDQVGLLGGYDDGAVLPEYGLHRDSDDQRTFSYMSGSIYGSGELDDGSRAVFQRDQWIDTAGFHYADDTGYRKGHPSGFQGSNPAWVAYGTDATAPYTKRALTDVLYLRRRFQTFGDPVTYEILIAADDAATVWVDDQEILTPDPHQDHSWHRIKKATVTLPADVHLIGIKVTNRRDNSPIACAFVMRELDEHGDPVAPYFIRTEVGGGWLASDGTPPPFWHRAQIIRDLIKENEFLGVNAAANMPVAFSGDNDSDGVAWDDLIEKVLPVGQSLLQSILELADEIDVKVDPESMGLRSWVQRGRDLTGSVTLDLGGNDGTLKSYRVETKTVRANSALIHLNDGTWLQVNNTDSVDAIGVVLKSVTLGSTGEDGTAHAAAFAYFHENGREIRTITAQPSTADGPLPYRDYDVGDIIRVPNEDGDGYMHCRVTAINVDATGDVIQAWPELVEVPTSGVPPRRTTPNAAQLLAQRLRAHPGLASGGSRAARPAPRPKNYGIDIPAYVKVIHGDDPNVQRPTAETVLWEGAADPVFKHDNDFRYPVTG